MKKIIVFDMDGTLVDSSDMIVSSVNFIRKNLGFEVLSKDIVLKNINDPKIDANKFFYQDIYFDENLTQKCNRFYEENCTKNIKLFHGVNLLLDTLSKKYTLDIATNTYTDLSKKMLRSLGVEKYFTNIIGYDKVKNIKPSGDILFYSIQKHQLKNEAFLFIGDSDKDKICAKNANIDFLYINWEKDTINSILNKIENFNRI